MNSYVFIPYLKMLIDENKVHEQKIQLDIGFNMTHISDKRRITHFSQYDNVICRPSSPYTKNIRMTYIYHMIVAFCI